MRGLCQALTELGVHPDSEVAGVIGVVIVHAVLAAEGHRDRQPPAFGEPGKVVGRVLRPARTARHNKWSLCAGKGRRNRGNLSGADGIGLRCGCGQIRDIGKA